MLVSYLSEDGCGIDHHYCPSIVVDLVARRHVHGRTPPWQTIRFSGSLDDEHRTTSKAAAARLIWKKI